jgi:hypothetical protein
VEQILNATQLQRTSPPGCPARPFNGNRGIGGVPNRRRWWYAGLTDAAQILISRIGAEIDAGQHDTALVLLRTLRAMFVRAEDHERVKQVDAHIDRVAALGTMGKTPEKHVLISVVIPCYRQASLGKFGKVAATTGG